MKTLKQLTVAFLFGIVFPSVMLSMLFPYKKEPNSSEPPETTAVIAESVPDIELPRIAVLMDDGQVLQTELEDYVTGVLLQEVPSNFPMEALKAQAVATRTYTLRRYERSGKHENADVCTDPSCCQAFRTGESYLSDGGSAQGLAWVKNAVSQTRGQVLRYDGQLIEATYFSCSGGMTEAAVAVWGEDIPYLQATQSPGEEEATHYTDTVYLTGEDLSNLLGVPVTGKADTWIRDILYTSGGGVKSLKVCGHTFSGTQLRTLLHLRSTAFTVEPDENGITITTRGYGHRVGMSQYGARAMARQGSDYTQILAHYYLDTQLAIYGS